MSNVQAVYRRGVFEPLGPVHLPEEQRVRLNFEVTDGQERRSWLAEICTVQAAVLQRRGPLPDSASDIAADRMR